MLTKNDLNSIRVIVREEVKSELVPVRKDIDGLKEDASNLQKDMLVVKKGVRKLRKDLTKTINFFDKSSISTREKVNKTRRDLGLNEVEFAY